MKFDIKLKTGIGAILFFLTSIVSMNDAKATSINQVKKNDLAYLTKYKWKLIQMNGVEQKNTTAYLVFAKNNNINGSGGCNFFSGNFEFKKGKVEFKNIITTAMGCLDPEISNREGDFYGLLSEKDLRYDIADQTLNFYKGDKLVLMLARAPLDKKSK